MSSKEQAHSKENASPKKQTAQPKIQTIKQLTQQIPPLTIQRAGQNLQSLTPSEVLQLQHTIGNRALTGLLASIQSPYQLPATVQRETLPEVKDLQAQLTFQRGEVTEGREASPNSVEDRTIQAKSDTTTDHPESSAELRPNKTGLPDDLKAGVENLSGYSLDEVRVHYNSPNPTQLQALAYAQGTEIHIAPRQEEHLPHEAWHVVQQMQGRVKPSVNMKGVQINDEESLESEADEIGHRVRHKPNSHPDTFLGRAIDSDVIQCVPDWMRRLIVIAYANPITSLAAAAGTGIASLIAYYYWRRQPQVPPQIQVQQQEQPDVSTLEKVAAAIGVEPAVLRQQLEEGVGDIDVTRLYDVDILPWEVDVIGLVPPSLIEGLPEAPAEKVQQLFQRINAWPFTYTGVQGNAASGFLSRSGDCATLALMFQLATKAAGVEGVELAHDYVPMLVASAPIHGRETNRNVDGEAYWYFDDHHWCEYNGQRYDVLFMTQEQLTIHHKVSDSEHNGVKYTLFDGGQAIIYLDQFVPTKLTTQLQEGRQGYVASTEDDIRAYIDQHRPQNVN